MTAILLTTLIPLLSFVGFGLCYAVWSRRHRRDGLASFERLGFVLYLGILALPLLAIVLDEGVRHHLLEALSASGDLLTLTGWLAVGALAGLLLAVADNAFGQALAARSARAPVLRHGAVNGRAEQMAERIPAGRALGLLVVVFAVVEESLWRGFLLAALQAEGGTSEAGALVVSALSFGLAHYYFGIRNVAAKLLLGLAWGGLVLAGGGLWAAVVSHLVYDAVIGRSLLRRREPTGSAMREAPT
jgi:membrane protease YdiL (CAAX protease family)